MDVTPRRRSKPALAEQLAAARNPASDDGTADPQQGVFFQGSLGRTTGLPRVLLTSQTETHWQQVMFNTNPKGLYREPGISPVWIWSSAKVVLLGGTWFYRSSGCSHVETHKYLQNWPDQPNSPWFSANKGHKFKQWLEKTQLAQSCFKDLHPFS